MIEALCARVENKAEIVAELINDPGIGGKEVPVRNVGQAQPGCELAHALRRIDAPVETNADHMERILAQCLLRDIDRVTKVARDRRADMVTARVDHADDERLAAQLLQVERLAVGVAQREFREVPADGRLAERQRVVVIVAGRRGRGACEAGDDTGQQYPVETDTAGARVVLPEDSRHCLA